jgi:tetratricopeptide (TPR) repeat protein
MSTKEYVKILENSKKLSTPLMCEYCGVETASIGAICMCSNCESMVITSRSAIEKKDHMLLDALDGINSSISNQKYDDAISVYDKLVAERKEPRMMYAAAIAHLKYSNYEITQIGYMRQGFMDENTLHRDKAAKLASSAKRLLTKSISLSKAEIAKGNTSIDLVYNRFLAQIKIGSKKGAKDSAAMLGKSGNKYASDYAAMVFESSMERYDNAMNAADELTKTGSFSVNAFYYIGLALFKKGKPKDAKLILQSLNSILKSSNLEALIFEIDYQLANLR